MGSEWAPARGARGIRAGRRRRARAEGANYMLLQLLHVINNVITKLMRQSTVNVSPV